MKRILTIAIVLLCAATSAFSQTLTQPTATVPCNT